MGQTAAWSVSAGGTAIKGKSICWSYPATLALNRTRQRFREAYVQLKRATVDHGSRNPTAPAYLGDTLHSRAAVRLWLQKQLQDRDWKPVWSYPALAISVCFKFNSRGEFLSQAG